MKDPASPPIAQGRTAELYLWDDGHVLKLFREWCPSDWVDYEAGIARAVHASGIPSPAAGDIVEVNGRRGLVYERLEGISMLQEMYTRPWTLVKHAHTLAELQVQINGRSVPGLPSYKDRLEHDIRSAPHLGEDLRNKILAALDALPDGQNLCHGDLHPGNILITKQGPVAIDWMNACSGVPEADVARTKLLINIGARAAGNQVSAVTRTAIRLYSRIYQNRYLSLAPDVQKQVDRWMPFVLAARLKDDIAPERDVLLKLVQEGM